jgi:predicted small secreted protein
MKKAVYPVLMAIAAAWTLGSLAACNTVEGAGKDVKSAGKAIERTADDNKPRN